jgi:hypothetical protein
MGNGAAGGPTGLSFDGIVLRIDSGDLEGVYILKDTSLAVAKVVDQRTLTAIEGEFPGFTTGAMGVKEVQVEERAATATAAAAKAVAAKATNG